MQLGNIKRFKSWFVSAGIVVAVTLWIASGSLGGSEDNIVASDVDVARPSKNAVRVRTQSAEEVMRTIVVNGKTAPARIAQLSAETDGRIEYIGAERGASLERGNLIVRMDERDRTARLAQAEATVKQREVERRHWLCSNLPGQS
jgi:multidrug efflux system membrane fusion protein